MDRELLEDCPDCQRERKSKTQSLRQIMDRIRELRKLAAASLEKQFPVGTEISYRHGDCVRHAEVIELYGFGLRIKVRGVTGAEYWIDANKCI